MDELLRLPQSRSSPSSLSSSSAADPPKEFRLVLLGTDHKKPLFEKMCSAALKFEQHVQYADIWYLTFRLNDSEAPVVVELTDPGTEKTGERQMAIQQKSDAIILCYSAYNPDSFTALQSVAEDFQTFNEQAPATLLLCNEDQLAEEGFEDGHESTADDGYGTNSGGGSPSNSEMPQQTVPQQINTTSKRSTHSMERIREAREGVRCPIEREKGEQLCRSLGSNCEFRAVSFSAQLADQFVLDLVTQLIRCATEMKQQRRQNLRQSQPSRPIVASARRRLSPSPLVHILRRKTSNIRRKMMHQVKSKTRDRSMGTAEAAGKEQKEQEEEQTMAAGPQQASTSTQEFTATNINNSLVDPNADGDDVTIKTEQPIGKNKNYVQGMGAMLKTLTHPRERGRTDASKGEENAVHSTERQNRPTADEADPSDKFMEEKETAAMSEKQREGQQRERRNARRAQSTTCTIQ